MAQDKSKNVSVGIASGVLSKPRSRNYTLIQNKEPLGGNNIYILLGDSVATTSNGIVLGPTEVWDTSAYYGGNINAIADVGPVNILLVEY